jgi:hypothetical protein
MPVVECGNTEVLAVIVSVLDTIDENVDRSFELLTAVIASVENLSKVDVITFKL